MIKKHGKEIALWILIPIFIVLALLFIVYIFEVTNIHVPGSREMWIGLIGAVLGGMFTMIGVHLTIYKQEEQDEERKRLEYMPILAFEIIEADRVEHIRCGEPYFDSILTCSEGELCTSAFQCLEEKICKVIQISVLNNACVFDFKLEGCLINGKEVRTGDAFNPDMRRLVSGEKFRLIFDNADYSNENEFCLIRFSYKDLFGNKYYQDLPIEYIEIYYDGLMEHSIVIRDIKAPIIARDGTKRLEDVAKEYCDYNELCQ